MRRARIEKVLSLVHSLCGPFQVNGSACANAHAALQAYTMQNLAYASISYFQQEGGLEQLSSEQWTKPGGSSL